MVPSSSSFSPRHDGALEQPRPDPSLAPAAEPLPHRVAVAEFNRQVSPGKTGPQQGVDPAQKAAVTPFVAALPDPPNVSGALPPLVLDDFKVAVWVSSATASVHRCGFAASR